MSTASDLIAAILVRCQAITTDTTYLTDIGESAEINVPLLNPEEVTGKGALIIYDSSESAGEVYSVHTGDYECFIELTVEGHIRIGSNNAVTLSHNMIDDIKTAVLDSTDATVGGLVEWINFVSRETEYPDRAGDIVSVRLNFQTMHYETYGSP